MGTLLALLAAEIVLRIHDPFGSRIHGDKIVLPVHASYRLTIDGDYGIERSLVHTKNSLGFRGEEPPPDFAQRLTFVTIGGSTTECFFLSDGKTWSDLLLARLRAEFPGAWLDNAGLDGTSTFAHEILLEDYVVKLHPRYVLFLVGANDYGRSELNRYDRALLPETPPFLLHLLQKSALFCAAQTVYRGYQAYKADLPHNFGQIPPLYDEEITPSELAVGKALHAPMLPEYADRLRRLIFVARGAGIEPVFMTQPTLFARAGSGKLTKRNLYREVLEDYNDTLRSVGRESHVLVIDLQEMSGEPGCFYDKVHFTNRGAERVAEIAARSLIPWLKGR